MSAKGTTSSRAYGKRKRKQGERGPGHRGVPNATDATPLPRGWDDGMPVTEPAQRSEDWMADAMEADSERMIELDFDGKGRR